MFSLVAQRALQPGSKLAATDCVAKRVAVTGCAGFTDDAAYGAMDFLLDALDGIAAEVFGSVAHLLNLDLDIIFVDTTSTYFELDVPDELADLQAKVDDDGISRPVENGSRAFGHSKDFRTDLPQVVIAMAVTRDGVPVRCWTFPGNTADTTIMRTVKDDLAGWNHREDRIRSHVQLCWLALLLLRIVENATNDTWRNVRHELDQMHLVTLATADGHVAQRSATTAGQKTILGALKLPEPPRFLDFTVPSD